MAAHFSRDACRLFATMEQATGSADRPDRLSALLATRHDGFQLLSVTEWELTDDIPEAAHPQ